MKDEKQSSFAGLAAVICGIFMIIAVMFLILGRDQLEILVPLVWAFVILGIVLGAFQYKLLKGSKK